MAEENEDKAPRDNNNSPPSSGEDKEKQSFAGRFKSPEDLEKGYQELEKKLGEQGRELGEARKKLTQAYEYQSYTQPVVQAIDNNPNLRKEVLTELGIDEEERPVENTKQQTGTTEDTSAVVKKYVQKEVGDVKAAQRKQAIQEFEKSVGISDLEREKQSEQRKEMGKYLSKWFPQGIDSIPATQLSEVLDDAYKLANTDSIKSQGKAEGRVEERKVTSGAIGSIPSGEVPTKEQVKLTPKQKEVAKKMGLSEEDYVDSFVKVQESYEQYEA